jgi:hypothetical protein
MENEVKQLDPIQVQVSKELVRVQSRPSFLALMQKVSEFEVPTTNVRVTNDSEEATAVELVGKIRAAKKALNDERLSITTFPRKFIEAVNGMFKGIGEMAERQIDRTDKQVRKYRDWKEAEARKAAEEAAKRAAEQTIAPECEGIEPPCLPKGEELPKYEPITRANGQKAYDREYWVVEVVDPVKLMRAALNKRSSKVPMAVVSIDDRELRKAVESGELKPKEWMKYGVKAAKEKKTVYSK